MLRQQRVVIDRVEPQINCGSFYIKRVVGQPVEVSADVLVDGHDVIAACVAYKHEKDRTWKEQRMTPGFNDSWHGSFTVSMRATMSRPGAPTIKNVSCHGLTSPIRGKRVDSVWEANSTTRPPRRYAMPAPTNTPME